MQDRDEKPIKIGRLQRYATDHVFDNKIKVLSAPAKKTGKKVAVLGGGPAGLGCAANWRNSDTPSPSSRRKPKAGGLNTYGIASTS
jgi:dihydropyrimidine dehydrogenase (NAD+) subunit PreT